MKKFIVLILALNMYLGAFVQFTPGDTLKYRISPKDKVVTDYPLQKPEKYLSIKSIERRKKQGLPIDSTDLPVYRKYVGVIRKTGVHVLVTGKWDNFATVSCNDSTLIDEIAKLPFVHSTERAWESITQGALQRDSLINKPMRTDSLYGPTIARATMSHADPLYDTGFKGQGMTIAIIDAGFRDTDRIDVMKNIHILGARDFVNPEADVYAGSSHGISVLSCMAMNQPHVTIGIASKAPYWLLRSEDEYLGSLVEQDYQAAVTEPVDSVGVDLASTSLGYYSFDDPAKNYRHRDLNSHYVLMFREAARAVNKRMAVACNAGNSGADSWKKITPPRDTGNIITVGAAGKKGKPAPLSSAGNTADRRVRPDVVAVGLSLDVVGTDGNLRRANGIFSSSPIMRGMIACLWQACSKLTAEQIIDLACQSGDRADFPDSIYGYGVPDLWKAYLDLSSKEKK